MTVLCSAYFSAQGKLATQLNIEALHLGMTASDLETAFGVPSAQNRNRFIYIFDDSSELIVTLRDGIVSNAQLKFHRPLKIEDPQLRKLTLVEMDSSEFNSGRPGWFFAGKPEDGLIYKINAEGVVVSLTWVPPFTYRNNQPKQLQALLQDFKREHLSNL